MFELNSVYYSKSGKTVLHDITLSLSSGKIYAVLGLNGSGKTTLLKILSQIWPHSAGTILWQGEDLRLKRRQEISRLISVVPHSQPITFGYTVDEIVAMGGYSKGLINDYTERKHALESVDAWHLKERLITEISYGERQRALIGRAVYSGSSALLFDEPTTGLDTKHQIDIWRLFRDLRDKGKLIIVTTHDIAMAKEYCDEVILLHDGHCVGCGPYSDIITQDVLTETFGVSAPLYYI